MAHVACSGRPAEDGTGPRSLLPPGAVVAADRREARDLGLDNTPRSRVGARGGLKDDGRAAAAHALDVQAMTADVDEALEAVTRSLLPSSFCE